MSQPVTYYNLQLVLGYKLTVVQDSFQSHKRLITLVMSYQVQYGHTCLSFTWCKYDLSVTELYRFQN